ncbi:MAG: M28 family peptidase [Acidobacteria bacterium]|nr:MAG: M28 family peptidase [Acidobacteriota bacterium]
MKSSRFTLALILAVSGAALVAQEQADPKTLIASATLNSIAQHISGAQARNHVLEMCPFERNRPAEEYTSGTYRESLYAEKTAKEYGFSDVHIERFPLGAKQWDGEMGELWVTEPGPAQLVTRYRDIATTLATGSRSADVTAELIYVGRGDTAADYAGKDVKGKIVLASGPVGAAHNLAVRQFGAEGVVSFFNGTGKPIDRPDQMGWSGIQASADPAVRTTWGFILSLRMGLDLLAKIERHQKVMVHAIVKAAEYDAPMNVVVATIPGDGSTNEEFHFTAHLFEGIAKQGANDNCGGPATQLEAGRAWIEMIKDGTLPKPKRTVRFLWVPEISGTTAYLRAHPDLGQHVVASVSTDMVGANQSINHNSLHLNQTMYSIPSIINDVSRQFFEYVGETNREKLHNRRNGYAFQNPMIDPSGTRDPFNYNIEKFYGSSDHQVHLDWNPRIPAVQFGNWPDAVYHSSDDSPANQDPTQMKRAAFLMVTVGSVFANSGPNDVMAVAGVALSYAQQRIAADLRDAMAFVASATAETYAENYKEALNLVKQAYVRERLDVRSAATLALGDKGVSADVNALADTLTASETADTARVKLAAKAAAARLKTTFTDAPILTAAEQAAAKLVPARVANPPAAAAVPGLASPTLTGYYTQEARNFTDGQRSILDIRNAISAEFGPVSIETVVNFFRNGEKQGQYTIVVK